MAQDNNIDKILLDVLQQKTEGFISELKNASGPLVGRFISLKDEVCDLIDAQNDSSFSKDVLKNIYVELLSNALQKVQPLKVGYLGPEGTFSYEAMTEFFGASVSGQPHKTISDVFREVEIGKSHYGIVPVENSTEGAVTCTLDELIETDLHIVAEKYKRIAISFLSNQKNTAQIKIVYTHPQPLGQCKTWLRENYPAAEIYQVDSTTQAAEMAKKNKQGAALASMSAAKIYKLDVVEEHVEDSRNNYTRFFIISGDLAEPSGNDKTSIVFSVKDRPGALFKVLSFFKDAGINMTKIESRPDKKKMWEYNFFIDFQGHRNDREIRQVLESINSECIFLKILGSYPVGKQ